LRKLPQNVMHIEVRPPEQIGRPHSKRRCLIIDDQRVIRMMLSTLKFKKSSKEAIAACKAPPGFGIRLALPDTAIDMEVTLGPHRHLVIRWESSGERVHYALPRAFETAIRPFLTKSTR